MTGPYRDESRRNWNGSNEVPTHDQVKLGCMQRIADACELIAKDHDKLVRERDMYMRWQRESREEVVQLTRQRNALRGVITKLKKAAP
jgi:hypothetical protein